MSVQVWSGPARIVGSGVVTTFGGHPLILWVEWSGGQHEVVLEFRPGEAPNVAVDQTDGRWHAVCEGFDAEHGKGTAEPALIHSRGGRSLLLHFRSTMFGKSADRTVMWTFYEAPADPGR